MGQYPWTEFFLLKVLLTIVFYPTRQHAYRVVILAVSIYVSWVAYQKLEDDDSLKQTYGMAGMVASQLGFVAYILLAEGPFPNHWRRVSDEVNAGADPKGLDKLPSNFPFSKKLSWMNDLSGAGRMIGWVQEPRGCIPPHPPPSRRTYLWKTFFKLVMNAVATDIAMSVVALSPTFDNRVHDPTDGPETYLAAVPLLRRLPYVLAWAIGMGSSASMVQNIGGMLFVGLGWSSPTLWPDMWGSWGDAYTVRKLWGQVWHQSLRPTVAGLGKLVANKILRFPRGTNLSSYTQLYVAFLLSGFLHAAGDIVMERRMVYHPFKFFLLQAVAITFEDFIIYLAKSFLRRVGVELRQGKDGQSWAGVVVRIVGYCWVMFWLCYSLPMFTDDHSALGFNSFDRGPISQLFLNGRKQRA